MNFYKTLEILAQVQMMYNDSNDYPMKLSNLYYKILYYYTTYMSQNTCKM